MHYRGILFDLDGTLLKTADDLGAALNAVLRHYDLPQVGQDAYTEQASNGAKALLELGFGEQLKNHNFDKLRGHFLDYYLNNIANHTQYYDEVAETLTFLNHQDLPWGIVTNKPEDLTTALLRHFPLLENCHVVVGGDTVGVAKPDPKPMYFALDKLALQPQQCLYVGDARRDIQAGRNAGMTTVAARYGYIGHDDDIDSWQADFQINRFDELLKLLKFAATS